jgi:hypothetical protein
VTGTTLRTLLVNVRIGEMEHYPYPYAPANPTSS